MNLDLLRNHEVRRAISPAAAVTDNTPFVSEIIDLKGAKACHFMVALGALADADTTLTVLVEDGDDASLSDNAAVADEFLFGTEALAAIDFADDNATRVIGYHGPKRYVRLTITPANNTGNIFLAALAVLSGQEQKPVDANS
jgi:hypothetical protein